MGHADITACTGRNPYFTLESEQCRSSNRIAKKIYAEYNTSDKEKCTALNCPRKETREVGVYAQKSNIIASCALGMYAAVLQMEVYRIL